MQEHGAKLRSPAFFLRKARADDAEGILECLALAFAPFREAYTPGAFSDTVLSSETIPRRMVEMSMLVAVGVEGEIAGCIAYKLNQEKEGRLRGMAVRPEFLGSGAAQSLLEWAEKELRKLGCERVTLNTTAPLTRAMRFYERNGFRRSGTTSDFFAMPLFEYLKILE
jgi:N-acetylglutamate synthase-like GNAT family acetyltransferase